MDRRDFTKKMGIGLATVAVLPLVAKEKEVIYSMPQGFAPYHPHNWQIPRYEDGKEEHFGIMFKIRRINMTHRFFPCLSSGDQTVLACPYSRKSYSQYGIDKRLKPYYERNKGDKEVYIHYTYCDEYPDLISTTFTTLFMVPTNAEESKKAYSFDCSPEEWWKNRNDWETARQKRDDGEIKNA